MTATVDASILLYAGDEDSPHQERAVALLEHLAVGPALVQVFWPVVMAYLRIGTNPHIFKNPLPLDAAMANIDSLLDRPHVRGCGEADEFWSAFRNVAEDAGPRGNLMPDAHLVALMHQHGVSTIWTHDRDFRKFSGITVKDPFDDKYAAGFG